MKLLSLVGLVWPLIFTAACSGGQVESSCPEGGPALDSHTRTEVDAQATALPSSARDRTRVLAHRGAVGPGLDSPDEDTVVVDTSNVTPLNDDGTINVVVEIPAGTIAKFELHDGSDNLKLEYEDERPRLIDFLPYPSNYGSVPKTLVDKADGGDGDPVDVILIGPALERGNVQAARVIGALEMIDRGEVDHKLIAIANTEQSGFAKIRSVSQLREKYPGATEILEAWFLNYKGRGKVEINAWWESERANEFFQRCVAAYGK